MVTKRSHELGRATTNLHAVQVVASIDEPAAGPSTTVRRLAECLGSRGVWSELFCIGNGPSDGTLVRRFPSRFDYLPVLGSIISSPQLRSAISAAASQGAVLHNHGLWLMPNVYPGTVARRQGTPFVFSPRGMLGPEALQFSKLKKQLFWRVFQSHALTSVSCFHATAPSEADDIRAMGLRGPVAIVPNGIDIPEAEVSKAPVPRSATRTLLYLGRIHPKKGIDRLIKAWALVEVNHPKWCLRIVGPGKASYVEALGKMARELRLNRVSLDGPVYGTEKLDAYQAANLFVLPTLHENFGMVVAEALATGVPVVCSKGAPWSGMVEKDCGWWVDNAPEALAAALDEAMDLPPETLAEMGRKGRAWMRADFSWDSVACEMEQVYLWCLGQAARPNCVVD